MKLASLHLRAYGPFTGTILDFEKCNAGLQLVFGPNEAGKSSTLRAIHALLYGVHTQTEDDFVHDYPDLRVGAVLVGEDGRRHPVMRRKRSKNDLFLFDERTLEEATDQALPADYILRLLPAVDEELFVTLYGLSHGALRDGGMKLLSGEGNVGTTLFAAGAGLADVKGVLESLDEEARSLFLNAGQKQAVNVALREYTVARQAYRGAMVRPQDWKELDDKAREAKIKVQGLEADVRSVNAELTTKRRLRDLGPVVRTRQALLAALAQSHAVVKLPADARERVSAERARIAAAQEQMAEAKARLEENQELLDTLVVSTLHLGSAAEIGQLHSSAAMAREARTRISAFGVKLHSANAEIGRLAGELGTQAAEAPKLVPKSVVMGHLKTYARLLTQALMNAAGAVGRGDRAQENLETAKRNLDATQMPGDISGLEAVLETLQRQGDLEASATAKTVKAKEIGDDLRRLCAALNQPDEEVALALALPQRATIDEMKSRKASLDARGVAFVAEEKSISQGLDEVRTHQSLLEAKGSVVTVESLQEFRAERDRIWAGVRAAFIDRLSPPGVVATHLGINEDLLREYEARVRVVDEKADLLLLDTERSTKYREYQKRVERMQGRQDEIDAEKAKLVADRTAWDGDWAEILRPLGLKSYNPDALLEWMRGHDKLGQRAGERDAAVAEEAALRAAIANGLSALQAAYAQAGITAPSLPSLNALITHAKAEVKSAQKRMETIAGLTKEMETAQQERERAALELERVEAQISKLTQEARSDLAAAGLAETAKPEDIDARLDIIRALADALRDVRQLQTDIEESQAIWDQFWSHAAALAVQLAASPPSTQEQCLVFAASAYGELEAAKQADLHRQGLQKAISTDRQKFAAEQAKEDAAGSRMTELVKQANCAEEANLDAAIEASEKRRQTENELEKLNAGLVQYSEAERSTLLEAAAAIANPAALQHEITELEARLAPLDDDLQAARAAAAQANAELDRIDGSANAAAARDAMEHHAASMQRSAERYARTRLAHELLGIAIRTYQDKSQGPLVKKASEWFMELTQGRFERLAVEVEEDGQVLRAVRSDWKKLEMRHLSEGTADQLYLALRLAAIDQRLETSHAMPLILDDALLAFDDDRAAAALKALARLGERNQVLLFTHHAHVMELAVKNLKAPQYGTHQLAQPNVV